jgi:sialate O-acetylesterase
MSAAALASNPAFAIVNQRWEKTLAAYPAAKAEYDKKSADRAARQAALKEKGDTAKLPNIREPQGPGHQNTPSGLFNGMINPLLPCALRGIIWYQGEANAGRAGEYHALFAAMITQWRANFGQGDLPFFWVQLANYKAGDANGTNWAFLREAQAQTLSLPMTGQAVTIDIGEPDDIHPQNKQEVGRRLALIARAKVYGATLDYTGPVFAAAKREGPAMRVSFAQGADGLTARGKPLQSFELAGPDKIFHPATAAINTADNTILVTAKDVPDPVAVRYAWRNAPDANLFNSAGLPATPFRSDDWAP